MVRATAGDSEGAYNVGDEQERQDETQACLQAIMREYAGWSTVRVIERHADWLKIISSYEDQPDRELRIHVTVTITEPDSE